ncbi:MAG TPA: hypothetical protein VE621_20595 [Bryobacteraceae bacterium]|nr:hypothetical protein [Bryobacteraceae bacterium]
MLRPILLLCIFALTTAAQTNPWFNYIPALREYLTLTDAQVDGILANNATYNREVQERQTRITQVQTEIASETKKENIDPLALGMRYAEIESHCRFLSSEAERTMQRNREVLTDAQRARLAALEEAKKLLPAISEGEAAGLMTSQAGYVPFNWIDSNAFYSTTGSRLGGGLSACYFPSNASGLIRNPFPLTRAAGPGPSAPEAAR